MQDHTAVSWIRELVDFAASKHIRCIFTSAKVKISEKLYSDNFLVTHVKYFDTMDEGAEFIEDKVLELAMRIRSKWYFFQIKYIYIYCI